MSASKDDLSKIVHSFNQSRIEQRVADGYINLNQMAKATGKRIDNWLRLKATKELLDEFDSQIASFSVTLLAPVCPFADKRT